MTSVQIVEGGKYRKDIKPGNIYRMDGTLLLVAKDHFPVGSTWRPGVFFLPDGTEPEVGKVGELGDLWWGNLPFYQDGDDDS